jgi:hypothetical protein
MFSQRTPKVQIKYCVWLVDLHTICAKHSMDTWFSSIDDIRKCLLDIKHGWTKTHFETWITRNDVIGVSSVHLPYLIILTAYLCSQWTPNVQIKKFMYDWSIYRPFVQNRGWIPDSLQIIIFVYVCSTWCIVELETLFDSWITRNDRNGISLFHLPYLITFMA